MQFCTTRDADRHAAWNDGATTTMLPKGMLRTAMLVLMTALTSACAGLPALGNRAASTAVTDTADTRLGRGVRVRLLLDDNGTHGLDETVAAEVRYGTEPKTSFLRRVGVGFLSILPIEWLL